MLEYKLWSGASISGALTTWAMTIGQQEVLACAGAITTLGLAFTAVYARFREVRREQDVKDGLTEIGRLRQGLREATEKIQALEATVLSLKNQLEDAVKAGEEWQRLYEVTQKGPTSGTPAKHE